MRMRSWTPGGVPTKNPDRVESGLQGVEAKRPALSLLAGLALAATSHRLNAAREFLLSREARLGRGRCR